MSIRPQYIQFPIYPESSFDTVGAALKRGQEFAREAHIAPRKIGIYKLIAVLDVDITIHVEPVDPE